MCKDRLRGGAVWRVSKRQHLELLAPGGAERAYKRAEAREGRESPRGVDLQRRFAV